MGGIYGFGRDIWAIPPNDITTSLHVSCNNSHTRPLSDVSQVVVLCIPVLHGHRSVLSAIHPRILLAHHDGRHDTKTRLGFHGLGRRIWNSKLLRDGLPMLAHQLFLGRLERRDDTLQPDRHESIQLYPWRVGDRSRPYHSGAAVAYASQAPNEAAEETSDLIHVLCRLCVSHLFIFIVRETDMSLQYHGCQYRSTPRLDPVQQDAEPNVRQHPNHILVQFGSQPLYHRRVHAGYPCYHQENVQCNHWAKLNERLWEQQQELVLQSSAEAQRGKPTIWQDNKEYGCGGVSQRFACQEWPQ